MSHGPLLLVLALALGLRLFAIDFGVPNRDHSYTYVPDEWHFFQIMARMNPGQLDFNPHYFFNPTLQIYLYGATFGVMHVAGLVQVNGGQKFYFDHPEQLAMMVVACRLWTVLFSTLTVWLIYLLARRLGLDRTMSTLAALLMALHPSHITNSHYMVVNATVTFWVVAAFLAMERWIRRGGVGNILWAGAMIGFATSTKYSGVGLFAIVALAGWFRWRSLLATPVAAGHARVGLPLRRALVETTMILIVGLVAFIAGSPYVVLAFQEFRSGLVDISHHMGAGSVERPGPFDAVGKAMAIHFFSSTPGLLLAALGGVWLALRRRKPLDILILAWLAPLMAISFKVGAWITDGRLMPVFPFLVLLAAGALAALFRWKRSLGMAATVVLVATLLYFDVAYLGRFVGPMPQQQASSWARANLVGRERIHLAGSATYYFPDLPLRELLQQENRDNYERTTAWDFVEADTYAEARAQDPDVVFLTEYLPMKPRAMEWLDDPGYELAAYFPGKVHFFGRRVHVPLDLYDVDTWVLRRKAIGSTR